MSHFESKEQGRGAGARSRAPRFTALGGVVATVAIGGWMVVSPSTPIADVGGPLDAATLEAALDVPVERAPGSTGPDVIVGDLHDLDTWGSVGDIVAYSVGTTSCNKGDQELLWEGDNNNHPVIGQNLYRLKDGRLEQIGQSWLKHGFTALAGNACGFGCNNPGTGDRLGVGCSDPYSAGLNGSQAGFGEGGLGPRFEVNPTTGIFPFPYTFQGQSGNAIYKRLQVLEDDVDPSMNAGALYFAEGHYIANDDSASGNDENNASYRRVSIGSAPNLIMSFVSGNPTQREKPAIQAWADNDGAVSITNVDVPADGRFHVASKATDNGDGTWRYDFAVHNLNSHRSAQSFSIPIPAGTMVTGVGFRDVPYHSGEPYANTDWSSTVGASSVTWSTDTFAVDPDANALRWGTMYNFWFDADAAPGMPTATITLFRTGSPSAMTVAVQGPGGAIFTDGFESGNTSAWSITTP